MAPRLEARSFLSKASDIASFYGFRPVRELEAAIPPQKRLRRVGSARSFEDVANVCVTCMAENASGPTLCFSVDSSPEHAPEGFAREVAEFGLSLVGSPSSLGDIVVLKTVATILRETGVRIENIRVGSLGDRESQARYVKELGLFVRKRAEHIPDQARAALFNDPLSLFSQSEDEVLRKIADEAPRALSFLSERSRSHLKEVLESLESLDVPYMLDERMPQDPRLPRLVFAVDIDGDNPLVVSVRGGRFDDYLRKVTGRKEGSGVRASIFFRKRGLDPRGAIVERTRSPKIYFVQLGTEAKLRALGVLEILRRARIPVYQSFETDRLGPQLAEAESLKVPYLIIMGHKEALEGAVIVRTVANRSQQVVPFPELPRFLKRV